MRIALVPIAVAAMTPSLAMAVDYMTPEQAQRALFPDAQDFVATTIDLDTAGLKRVQQLAGIPARSAHWQVLVARNAGAPVGYVVIDNVVGKYELITYAVGIGRDARVRQVEVLSYRESHGGEIRLPAWRAQFAGKDIRAPLRVGEDISNISGATMSCSHLADGVRRIVALLQVAHDAGALQ